jgi:hypothetical protein
MPFKQILVTDKYPQFSFLTIRTVINAVKVTLIVFSIYVYVLPHAQ